MMTGDYRSYLEERFHGEAAFGAMAEACTDPARADRMPAMLASAD